MELSDINIVKTFTKESNNRKYYLAICEDCDIEYEIRSDYIYNKNYNCCTKCSNSRAKTTHGYSHTRLYKVWSDAKSKRNNHILCDEWKNSFVVFKEWATKNGYAENSVLEYLDNSETKDENNTHFVNIKTKVLNRHNNSDGVKRLYRIHEGIIQRTQNVKNRDYVKYGARGILLFSEWLVFKNFEKWALANGYQDNLSIDRIDNNGNYEPDNCRWTTQLVQSRNTKKLRSTNKSGYRGVQISKGKFIASIRVNYKTTRIGTFENAIDGAKAYDKYVTDNNLEHTKNF